MKGLYIIPKFENKELFSDYAKELNLSFEYNDFILPDILDNQSRVDELISGYQKLNRDMSCDTMHGAFYDVNVFSYDREIVHISEKRMRQSMLIADSMGLRGVIFHGNYIPFLKRESYDTYWLKETARVVSGLLNDFPSVKIYMENMFDRSPEMLKQLAIHLKDKTNFGICFDYSHAVLNNGNVAEWFVELSPYIRHMHINDHCFLGDEHLVPGDGKTDWQEYSRLVSKYIPNVSVLCEVNGLESVKSSIRFLKKNKLYPYSQ